mgnify:CR=1 FL=1
MEDQPDQSDEHQCSENDTGEDDTADPPPALKRARERAARRAKAKSTKAKEEERKGEESGSDDEDEQKGKMKKLDLSKVLKDENGVMFKYSNRYDPKSEQVAEFLNKPDSEMRKQNRSCTQNVAIIIAWNVGILQ